MFDKIRENLFTLKIAGILFLLIMASMKGAFAQEATSKFKEPDTRETFKDWVVECFTVSKQKQACQLYQRILFNEGKSIALVVTMTTHQKTNDAKIQIAVPLGVEVGQGASLFVDKTFAANFNIDRCTHQGCLIDDTVSRAIINTMKSGKQAALSVMTTKGKPFAIPLSLKGFQDAYTHVSS